MVWGQDRRLGALSVRILDWSGLYTMGNFAALTEARGRFGRLVLEMARLRPEVPRVVLKKSVRCDRWKDNSGTTTRKRPEHVPADIGLQSISSSIAGSDRDHRRLRLEKLRMGPAQ